MGLIVTVSPETVTRMPLVTEMVSTVELSDDFLMTTFFPETAAMLSENSKTIFAAVATPVALSAGIVEINVGSDVSAADVKFNAEEEEMPAYTLLEESRKAPESMRR